MLLLLSPFNYDYPWLAPSPWPTLDQKLYFNFTFFSRFFVFMPRRVEDMKSRREGGGSSQSVVVEIYLNTSGLAISIFSLSSLRSGQ